MLNRPLRLLLNSFPKNQVPLEQCHRNFSVLFKELNKTKVRTD